MVEFFYLLLAFLVGIGAGSFHFGALWLTVRRLPRSRRPGLLVWGSLMGRIAVTLLAFYLVMGGHWAGLIACLAGFILARSVLVRRWKPVPAKEAAG